MMNANRFAVAACFCLLLAACQTSPVEPLAKVSASTAMLLPVSSLHEEMVSHHEQVAAALTEGLKQERLEVLQPKDWGTQSETALEASGAIYNPDIGRFLPLDKKRYTQALLEQLLPQQSFEVLVMPELVLRSADLDKKMLVWDGVHKALPLEDADRDAPLPKSSKGLSLRVLLYSRDGMEIMDGFYGVSIPYLIDYSAGKPVFRLKSEFFTEEEITDAVRRAMKDISRHLQQ